MHHDVEEAVDMQHLSITRLANEYLQCFISSFFFFGLVILLLYVFNIIRQIAADRSLTALMLETVMVNIVLLLGWAAQKSANSAPTKIKLGVVTNPNPDLFLFR